MTAEEGKPTTEILLAEYAAAQEGISHYERLIWTVGSVSNSLVVLLIGTFVKVDQSDTLLVATAVAIIMYSLWWLFEARYRQINISKFKRLWEIEVILGMNHHLSVKKDDADRHFRIRAHVMITTVCICFPIAMFTCWIFLKIQ